jgi:hypothetical protein
MHAAQAQAVPRSSSCAATSSTRAPGIERELIEPQEAVGLRVLGTFRDIDDPDSFVWLRGFANMTTRGEGLRAFYIDGQGVAGRARRHRADHGVAEDLAPGLEPAIAGDDDRGVLGGEAGAGVRAGAAQRRLDRRVEEPAESVGGARLLARKPASATRRRSPSFSAPTRCASTTVVITPRP